MLLIDSSIASFHKKIKKNTNLQGGPLQMQHGRFSDCGLPSADDAPHFFDRITLCLSCTSQNSSLIDELLKMCQSNKEGFEKRLKFKH